MPAAPRRGGCWGLHVLCFQMYEAPPATPGKPRKSRLKAEALWSNAAYCVPSDPPGRNTVDLTVFRPAPRPRTTRTSGSIINQPGVIISFMNSLITLMH
jgi:hypothetical protein